MRPSQNFFTFILHLYQLTTKNSSNTSSPTMIQPHLPNPKLHILLTHPRPQWVITTAACPSNTTTLSQASPHGTNHTFVHAVSYFVDNTKEGRDTDACMRNMGLERCKPTCYELFIRLRGSWRGPGWWAKGEKDLPPSDLRLLHSPPPLLPLHLNRFVPHLNLESELILSHTYLTRPLTPLKRNKTPSKACYDRLPNHRACMTTRECVE